MEGFDLKCELATYYLSPITGTIEYCKALNLFITSDEEITSVNGRTEPTSFTGFWIQEQTAHYLPKGIDKFFPNLLTIAVRISSLKSVTQDDLKPFTQFFRVDFKDNDLESLEGDLFKFNPTLQEVSFDENKLHYIGEHLLDNLKNLQLIEFQSNPCINFKATTSSEIATLIQKIKTQCEWPQDLMVIKSVTYWYGSQMR